MTRFPSGGSLYTTRRPVDKPVVILILIIAGLLLAACDTGVANNNWPGMTAVGNVVYVANQTTVLAVDVVEEQLLWSYPPEPDVQTLFYAPPSVLGDRVVIGDYGRPGGLFSPSVTVSVYSLDTSGGRPVATWTNSSNVKDKVVASPTQADDKVFVGTSDNRLLAFDAVDGRLLWQFETGHSVWTQPIYEDGVVYIASMDREVYAVDAATGQEIWHHQLDGAVAGNHTINSDLIYVSSFGKRVYALEKATGAERWRSEATAAVWGAPALAGDTIYYADIEGTIFAVDALSGELRWREETAEYVVAAPVVAGDVVYLATGGDPGRPEAEREGKLIAFDATTGDELWRERVRAPLYTTPVIVGDTIVIALQSEEALLMVFDLADGRLRWDFLPAARQ
jgi:outer membrane protein assembly factor BamB